MVKQTNSELVMSSFRKSINDGDIYVLTKRGNDLIGIDKVAYISGAEYNELASVANKNKSKLEAENKAKHDEEQTLLFTKLHDINDEILANYNKQLLINKKLLSIIKVMFGSVDGDLEVLIKELDGEVNKNE